jgi:DNA-directed RNA polymerase specialized sigma subunit
MPSRLNTFSDKKLEVPEEFKKWQDDPSPENYSSVITYLKPTISSGIKSFATPDMRVRSRIVVDKAIRSYDPSKGASLKSHVFNNMKGLQRIRAERKNAVHVPENVRLNKLHISEFEKDFHDKHGIIPSDQTIADKLKISQKAVQKARTGGESTILRNEKGDSAISQQRTAADIWTDYVYYDVDDVNKKIMEWTMGYNKTPIISKAEIARKLNITPAAVSSRIATISRKMEKGLDDGTGSL